MIKKPKAASSFLWCLALVLAQQANGELVVAKGLAVEPFATTEQLSNPASIDVDHRGRVWVGEAVNYRKKARKEGDLILILEDSDGDGNFDWSSTEPKEYDGETDANGYFNVTVAATSFLRYNHPRFCVQPPKGHISLWMEEQKIPPVLAGE